jgi:hypothetical protein
MRCSAAIQSTGLGQAPLAIRLPALRRNGPLSWRVRYSQFAAEPVFSIPVPGSWMAFLQAPSALRSRMAPLRAEVKDRDPRSLEGLVHEVVLALGAIVALVVQFHHGLNGQVLRVAHHEVHGLALNPIEGALPALPGHARPYCDDLGEARRPQDAMLVLGALSRIPREARSAGMSTLPPAAPAGPRCRVGASSTGGRLQGLSQESGPGNAGPMRVVSGRASVRPPSPQLLHKPGRGPRRRSDRCRARSPRRCKS